MALNLFEMEELQEILDSPDKARANSCLKYFYHFVDHWEEKARLEYQSLDNEYNKGRWHAYSAMKCHLRDMSVRERI